MIKKIKKNIEVEVLVCDFCSITSEERQVDDCVWCGRCICHKCNTDLFPHSDWATDAVCKECKEIWDKHENSDEWKEIEESGNQYRQRYSFMIEKIKKECRKNVERK